MRLRVQKYLSSKAPIIKKKNFNIINSKIIEQQNTKEDWLIKSIRNDYKLNKTIIQSPHIKNTALNHNLKTQTFFSSTSFLDTFLHINQSQHGSMALCLIANKKIEPSNRKFHIN